MSRVRILLVNGEPTVQHLRALMLRMKGYYVDTSATLEAAQDQVFERPYNLVIVDVGHFAAPGLEFCEEIKKKSPDLKVLMQVNDNVFLDRHSCPDSVVSKQEGPQNFIKEVETLLQAAS